MGTGKLFSLIDDGLTAREQRFRVFEQVVPHVPPRWSVTESSLLREAPARITGASANWLLYRLDPSSSVARKASVLSKSSASFILRARLENSSLAC